MIPTPASMIITAMPSPSSNIAKPKAQKSTLGRFHQDMRMSAVCRCMDLISLPQHFRHLGLSFVSMSMHCRLSSSLSHTPFFPTDSLDVCSNYSSWSYNTFSTRFAANSLLCAAILAMRSIRSTFVPKRPSRSCTNYPIFKLISSAVKLFLSRLRATPALRKRAGLTEALAIRQLSTIDAYCKYWHAGEKRFIRERWANVGEEENGERLGKYGTLWSVRGEIEARVLVYEELVPCHVAEKGVRGDGTYRGRQRNLFLRHRADGHMTESMVTPAMAVARLCMRMCIVGMLRMTWVP